MDSKEIKKTLGTITSVIFDRVKDAEACEAINASLNINESLLKENEDLHQENQQLKDEINRLKGEQGQPEIRPQKKSNNHSSEDDRKKRDNKKKKPRKKKKGAIKANRSVKCEMDVEQLPSDVQFKGYTSTIIQDLRIIPDNVEFQRAIYYSPSMNKTYIADLPQGYSGEFGPNIKSLVLALYNDSNMTQPALKKFLNTFGIFISKGTISRMLTDNNEVFHQEKEDIVDAGLQAPYQHIDDTSGRVNGKNHYVHVLSNPFYTAFFTCPKKDRLTILGILCRGELKFTFNEEAFELMKAQGLSEKCLQKLIAIKKEGTLTRAEIDNVLISLFPDPKKYKSSRRYILESAALTYYYTLVCSITHLMCDDAPQFNLIALYKALCWIHEGRHYKKLTPFVPIHREQLEAFRESFWDYYQKLLDYTKNPEDSIAEKLDAEFDVLFSTKTGYDDLDERIILTAAKKDALLLALKFPFLPLHNNDAEGGAQHQARLRDIHLQTKNDKGTDVKDTFATIVKTARKLGVNIFNYLYDRVSGKFSMPSLADLILEKCSLLNSS